MNRYRIPIRKVLNWAGKKDARQGRMPRIEGQEYLTGYSRQYAKEQIQSAQTIF
jgi:hypothetical protein